jgi:hypothetical protein
MTWLHVLADPYEQEKGYVRPLGVAESGTFDSDSGIAFSRLLAYFRPDVLSLSVTISPNE